MIVPIQDNYRRFFGPERFESAKIGETFSIDSGMGGAFTIACVHNHNGEIHFKPTNPGWEHWLYKLSHIDAAKRVYIYRHPSNILSEREASHE